MVQGLVGAPQVPQNRAPGRSSALHFSQLGDEACGLQEAVCAGAGVRDAGMAGGARLTSTSAGASGGLAIPSDLLWLVAAMYPQTPQPAMATGRAQPPVAKMMRYPAISERNP